MQVYAFLDGERVIRARRCATPPEGGVPLPPGISTQDAPLFYLLEGEWTPRPSLLKPVQDGDTMSWIDLPAGTRIEVFDMELRARLVEADEAGRADVQFPENGRYRIEVTPPFPFLPQKHEVTL